MVILIRRYRKLSLWSKFQFWGAITSIVGLILAFYLFARESTQESPKISPSNSQEITRAQGGQLIGTSTQLPNNAASQTVNITTGSKSPVVTESKGDVAITYK